MECIGFLAELQRNFKEVNEDDELSDEEKEDVKDRLKSAITKIQKQIDDFKQKIDVEVEYD